MAVEDVEADVREGIEAETDLEQKVILGSAALVVIGAFLPWAQFLGVTVLGIEGDGLLTLILGGLAAGLTYYRWEKKVAIGTAVLGLVIFVIAFSAWTNISGAGVYFTLLGGIAILGGGVSAYRKYESA